MRLRRAGDLNTLHGANIEYVCIFLLDGTTFSCPRLTLTSWSPEFDKQIDADNELVLSEFYVNSEEVSDCIELLKGNEVDVNFENVMVIVKFAIKFDIDQLLQELQLWFHNCLCNIETFCQTMTILHHIERIGLEATIHFYEIILEFVNNRSNAKTLKDMIEQNFSDLDTVILKSMLVPKNTHLHGLLHIIADKMSSEKQCRLVIQQLENLCEVDCDELLVHSTEVVMVLNKINDMPELKVDIMKSASKLMTKLFELSQNALPPDRIGLELLQRIRLWRKYSHDDILVLHKNIRLKEWEYTEIVVAWLKVQDPPPPQEVVTELIYSITRSKLPYDYVKAVCEHINQFLALFGYSHTRAWGSRWSSWHTSRMHVKLSEDECIALKNNNVARLRFQCQHAGCPRRSSVSKAVVSLQLINNGGCVSVNVVPSTSYADDHEHELSTYLHWYMTTAAGHFYSFFTTTFGELCTVFDEHRFDLILHVVTVKGSYYEEKCRIS